MSHMDWLFKPRPQKPPREVKRCKYCGGGFGLERPNTPYCKAACKEAAERPPDELVELLKYPP